MKLMQFVLQMLYSKCFREEIYMNQMNRKCMENILTKLTYLIQLSEGENIKYLSKLVDMSTSVSAMLLAMDGFVDEESEE